jgi:hypothetical protein
LNAGFTIDSVCIGLRGVVWEYGVGVKDPRVFVGMPHKISVVEFGDLRLS